jgi:hypothetical protein
MLNSRPFVFALAAQVALMSPTFAVAASGLSPLTTSEPMFVKHNGLALNIRSAVVPIPRESLATTILDAWRAAGTEGMRFDTDGDRVVLGRQAGPLHETLSLLQTDDPLSTAVIRALQDSRQALSTAPPPPFNLPAGMKIINTIEDYNGKKTNVTYRIDSNFSTRDSIERLRVSITDARWEINFRQLSDKGPSMITATREAEELSATALDQEATTRLVVSVTRRAP